MHDYELIYFPARGRAEHIRILLALKGIPYRETMPSDWPSQKPKTPFGLLPILIERGDDGEFSLAESGAILRHLARRFDMYGSGARQHAMCDSLADFIADSRTKYIPIAYAATFQTSPEAVAKYYEQLPQTLATLERALGRSQSPEAGWFIGDSVTFADVTAFDYLDGIEKLQPASLSDFPALQGFVNRFRALPALASFLATRQRP
ncbi:MAG: glutathione S-transferase family protein [Myxococcales bacterium]|nr:glutathione S-transferase family protein [Myxococcales bacterium]